MKQSVRIIAFVAAVALVTCAARAHGYWPQSTPRVQRPLPWTGPYVGLNLGYAWHHLTGVYDNFNNPTFLSGAERNGALVGGQLAGAWIGSYWGSSSTPIRVPIQTRSPTL